MPHARTHGGAPMHETYWSIVHSPQSRVHEQCSAAERAFNALIQRGFAPPRTISGMTHKPTDRPRCPRYPNGVRVRINAPDSAFGVGVGVVVGYNEHPCQPFPYRVHTVIGGCHRDTYFAEHELSAIPLLTAGPSDPIEPIAVGMTVAAYGQNNSPYAIGTITGLLDAREPGVVLVAIVEHRTVRTIWEYSWNCTPVPSV